MHKAIISTSITHLSLQALISNWRLLHKIKRLNICPVNWKWHLIETTKQCFVLDLAAVDESVLPQCFSSALTQSSNVNLLLKRFLLWAIIRLKRKAMKYVQLSTSGYFSGHFSICFSTAKSENVLLLISVIASSTRSLRFPRYRNNVCCSFFLQIPSIKNADFSPWTLEQTSIMFYWKFLLNNTLGKTFC